jgi:hypothetical protein
VLVATTGLSTFGQESINHEMRTDNPWASFLHGPGTAPPVKIKGFLVKLKNELLGGGGGADTNDGVTTTTTTTTTDE